MLRPKVLNSNPPSTTIKLPIESLILPPDKISDMAIIIGMPSKSSIFLSISSLLLRPKNLSTLSTNDLGCLESSTGLSSASPLTVGSSNARSSADILSICSVISVSLLRVSSSSCSSVLFLNLPNADGLAFLASNSATALFEAALMSSISKNSL